jgi:hypothetical protein
MSFHNQEEEPYYLEQKVDALRSKLYTLRVTHDQDMMKLVNVIKSMQKEIDELKEKLNGR